MHKFSLPRSFHPTSARLLPRPSIFSDQETHPYLHQDSDRSLWWCWFRGRGVLGGGGRRGPHNPSFILGGWQSPWQVLKKRFRTDSYQRTFSEPLPLSFWSPPPLSSSSSEQSIYTQIPLMQWNRSQIMSQD